MPFSWENCLRDEERAAPLTPFPLPLGSTRREGWGREVVGQGSEISGLYMSVSGCARILTFL